MARFQAEIFSSNENPTFNIIYASCYADPRAETFATSVNADGYYYITATINKFQVHHNGASKPSHRDLSVNWGDITNRQQRIMQRLQKWNNTETSEFLGGWSRRQKG